MHATARRPPALDARLLAEKLVSLRYIDGVSYETVRQVLKKNALKAHVVKDLVDVCYPDAERIVLVIDNLNTHTPAPLYEAFPPAEARRIVERLEIHYSPKHGSWLNVAEIELSAMSGQCLD